MARRRTRRNPIRTTGALIINPRRRKRRPTRRRTRRNALEIRSNRRRRTRRNALQIRTNRRRTTRKGMVRRSARRAYKPRRRNTRAGGRRKTARRAYRRNPRRRRYFKSPASRRRAMRGMYAKRRNRRHRRNTGRDFISKTSASLAKIPILGGFLSFAPFAAIGAIMVEPAMWIQDFLGRYVPAFPAPLFYALSGLLLAGLIKMLPGKFLSAGTKDKLAVAAASAAGGVAYYKWRSNGGVTETVAEELAGLEIRGYRGPMGLLELRGLSGFGGGDGGASAYGEYGPAAVMPLGTY